MSGGGRKGKGKGKSSRTKRSAAAPAASSSNRRGAGATASSSESLSGTDGGDSSASATGTTGGGGGGGGGAKGKANAGAAAAVAAAAVATAAAVAGVVPSPNRVYYVVDPKEVMAQNQSFMCPFLARWVFCLSCGWWRRHIWGDLQAPWPCKKKNAVFFFAASFFAVRGSFRGSVTRVILRRGLAEYKIAFSVTPGGLKQTRVRFILPKQAVGGFPKAPFCRSPRNDAESRTPLKF